MDEIVVVFKTTQFVTSCRSLRVGYSSFTSLYFIGICRGDTNHMGTRLLEWLVPSLARPRSDL